MRKRSISLLLFLLTIQGCLTELGDQPTDADDYEVQVLKAWLDLSSGNFDAAIEEFKLAVEMKSTDHRAYIGLAWSYAFVDDLKEAVSQFDKAINIDSNFLDAYAGKAFVLSAMDQHEEAILASKFVISIAGEKYVFDKIPDVNSYSLRLLIAESAYALSRYDEAKSQIDVIDPENDLNKDSSTYKRDLLMEIEKLKSNIQTMKALGI